MYSSYSTYLLYKYIFIVYLLYKYIVYYTSFIFFNLYRPKNDFAKPKSLAMPQ